mmetsp:Transcript_37474/g.73281  ORF Transcript_37474/g.73281 Transcript_37474/m.73281 type:complete len:169 (+) Transcript_37474:3-509(+)
MDATLAAPEGVLPVFVRPEEGAEEAEPEEVEEGGDGKGRLEKALDRIGLSHEEMAVLCGSTTLGWASPPTTAAGNGALDCGYFKTLQETLKARKAALKAVENEEEGAEPPPPLAPDAAMLSEKRFDAAVKKYGENQEAFVSDFVELFTKLSETGSVFDAVAPQGFYVG